MIFDNPIQAAVELGELIKNEDLNEHIIIGNSIKNIPFVDTIANHIGLCYELLFSKAIYAPKSNTQIAKISETKDIIFIQELIDFFEISQEYLESIATFSYDNVITYKINKFRNGKIISSLYNKDILLVDQGSNTGLTVNLCHKSLLNIGVRSIKYATTVISKESYKYFSEIFDKVYYLHITDHYINKDFYYKESLDILEEQAVEILNESNFYLPYKEGEQ